MSNKMTQQELMLKQMKADARNKIDDMQYRAAYFKALYEVRYYTIESDKLAKDYEAILERERVERLKAMEELKKEAENSNGQLKLEEKQPLVINPSELVTAE